MSTLSCLLRRALEFVTPASWVERVHGKRIPLADDVPTTGGTPNAAATKHCAMQALPMYAPLP